MTKEEHQQAALSCSANAKAYEEMARFNFQKGWPVGGDIQWVNSRSPKHLQFGTVIRHGYGARVYVRNAVTERAYWISHHDVFEGMKR